MSYQIQLLPPEKISKSAGESLTKILAGHAHLPVLLLLSGGSALDILKSVDVPADTSNITVSVLDERFSFDPRINNFLQLLVTEFYPRLLSNGARTINTSPLQNETQEQLTARFDATLKNWEKEHPTGVVIATQGIGLDGHTAGIVPMPENASRFAELFENKNEWAIGYSAENNPHPLRVTTTFPFLRDIIDMSVMHVKGEDKRAALKAALTPDALLNQTPAAIIQQMKNVQLFTDIKI